MGWTLHLSVVTVLFVWIFFSAYNQSAGKFCIAACQFCVALREAVSSGVNKGVEGAVTVESHSLRRRKWPKVCPNFHKTRCWQRNIDFMQGWRHRQHSETFPSDTTFQSQNYSILSLWGGTSTACLSILFCVKRFNMKLVFLTTECTKSACSWGNSIRCRESERDKAKLMSLDWDGCDLFSVEATSWFGVGLFRLAW